MVGKLVIVRHGESEWNRKNLFTGWKDPDITPKGEEEALAAGQKIKANQIKFDIAYTSALIRAQHTLSIILAEIGQEDLSTIKDEALNERDYGDLTGLNKDDARAKWGEEQVHIWRRSFDVPPPNGESLEMTAQRVLPYFHDHIMPNIKAGQNVLVAAHGNSLRSLIMDIESVPPEEIVKRELGTGVPLLYTFNEDCSFNSISEL